MSMLKQAIVDAMQLKEAAVKNAETLILEKYANEIKEAVDTMLEQDPDEEEGFEDPLAGGEDLGLEDDPLADLGMGGEEEPTDQHPAAEQIPLGATEGEKLCPCPEEEEEIEISFDELAQQMADEEEALDDLGTGEETGELPPEEDFLGEGELDSEGSAEMMVEVPSSLAPDIHLYHEGMDDPIYEVGELAIVGNPVPESLLREAITKLEGLTEQVDETHIQELQELIENLQGLVNTGETEETEELETTLPLEESDDILDEELLEELFETLHVDIMNVPQGHGLNANTAQKREAEDIAVARLQDDEVKEEIKALKAAVKELKKETKILQQANKTLVVENNSVKSIAIKAAEKLQRLNIKNAKLHYTNRILKSNSLNERQKKIVVETLSKAKSVEEAKTAFEMQGAVGESRSRNERPETLTETVNKTNTVFHNKETKPRQDPWKERNRILAGIKEK